MLNVDLSTLSGPELRQLLDTARTRGQAAVSYEVLQEMAARRERGDRDRSRAGRRGEGRVVELNLGDPLDHEDEWAEVPDREVAKAAQDPLTSLTMERPRDPGPPPQRRRLLGAGFAIGIAVGVAAGGVMGLAVAEVSRTPPGPGTSAVQYSSNGPIPAAPPAVLAVETAPPPEAVAAATPAAEAPVPIETAALSPEAEAQAHHAEAPVAEAPPEPKVEATVEKVADEPDPAASEARCAGQKIPAERAICEAPQLQRLQRELRQAYAKALGAHEDRDLLRQHQLEWRDARNSVSDPERLARLYEQRIRKLNAATAEAERLR